ncbi:bifunctional diaminohydroxyphosphoribosylaminopyrimidine deaminase/5-amino-6-(5-phosphoribosylamino)uracil reductase RibD [Crassaminicella profunda]|uniref:bifunctional diaminohydroxyphosphoribosylaminopyrimidine deaminase/5-amino-6-(5-phosphoribosylamino)uracil reductase RibD n=1 Tax=Crassaminicella profunda TaxID=1286698 RepID=UPI001CA5F488|nr:bifunctional diaminohydroxyphosphoribosylaminopyrimidine deaminase/5-amino-6-(5-phosphoribosylamino)uracil reductase RibD [Crassaminicella profunda]QZY55428.1 bifunctional diaminohydroxyphosphoribosylaminopyrimidine deaminase/5-amino-6-(5-phosphoribosylamino)uracil reductase RibD [Crassaminicella profunda]
MDIKYMKRALELAKGGKGYTNPNPLVGSVIVKNNKIIGQGYHKAYGGAHAEIHAFHDAKEDVTGATMYVTLEPCSHYGKTPPCAHAIVEKGIKKVIIAMKDPNPLVSGKGIEILKNNGIEVISGVLEKEARILNEIFVKYITTKLPFCILKTAMTLDGKIATSIGDSKWISNESSRKVVHKMRHQVSGIMVGIGTVLADDPLLTTRLDDMEGTNPTRIIVDTHGRIPLDALVLKDCKNIKAIIATTNLADAKKMKALQERGAEIIITPLKENLVDLSYLMDALGKKKIDSILLEGGATLNYSALKENIVDKIISFIAPKIIGGIDAKTPIGGQGFQYMKDAILLKDMKVSTIHDDLMIEAYIRKEA